MPRLRAMLEALRLRQSLPATLQRASKALHVGRGTQLRDPEMLQKLLHMVREGLRGAGPHLRCARAVVAAALGRLPRRPLARR
mgnify:CR=1 FL=1